MLRFFLAWFPLLALAIANGGLRQLVIAQKRIPELLAHQCSTAVLALLTMGYVTFLFHRLPPDSGAQAIAIGLMWLALTVGFEFFLGLVISRRPLAQVLVDYNLRAGRVWSLYLVWLAVAPWVVFHMR